MLLTQTKNQQSQTTITEAYGTLSQNEHVFHVKCSPRYTVTAAGRSDPLEEKSLQDGATHYTERPVPGFCLMEMTGEAPRVPTVKEGLSQSH